MNDKDSLIRRISIMIDARLRCQAHGGNGEWFDRWTARLSDVERNQLPSGSGIDNGTWIDLGASSADKIVLVAGFHHMNDTGMYNGWTHHKITVRPSFIHGAVLTISGVNRNDIKEYLHQTFGYALSQTYQPTGDEMGISRTVERAINADIESTKQSEKQS
jgi:hypothetical protein